MTLLGQQPRHDEVDASSDCNATRCNSYIPRMKKRREIHLNLSSQPTVGAVGKAVEPARCNILQLFLAQVAQPANHAPKYPAQTACTSARGSCCCIGSVVD